MKRVLMLVCVLILFCGCAAPAVPADPPAQEQKVPFALKGVWVSFLELDAAFAGANAKDAAAYIDGVMNTCQKDGFNTVFWHVRAMGDAYYASDLFPPADSTKALLQAGFDPLRYAVEAAHKQGLSLHAWINPYRIGTDCTRAICEDIYKWEEMYYYVPTSQTVQKHILNGVREVVHSYAVDGVQFDDYFYPAGLPETAMSFEKPPATLSVAAWRRAAVSGLVAAAKSAVNTRKGCVFGISPAGDMTRSEEMLYADVKRWLRYGYVDYMCPQIYSGFSHQTLPFSQTADDWAALPRASGVRLYVGLALYKTGENDTYAGSGAQEWVSGADILARQAASSIEKGYDGFAVFRYAHWIQTGGAVREAEKTALREILNK